MNIESITLKNFRNYEELHMDFSQGTNILYGDNAQGKTNVLEAVYLCSTTKSHRSSKDKEMIHFDEEESHIKLMVLRDGVRRRIDMHLKQNRAKGIAVDGIPIHKSSELFGIVNVVCFSPEDLNLIKSGPAQRRRFIDLELCQLDRVYVHHLVNYNKIVVQRNKLLKELSFRSDYADTLDVWDEQMVRFGQQVIELRSGFISQLNEIIRDIHHRLSGGKEHLALSYEPNTESGELASAVAKSREKDIRQKLTLAGPHRDDVSFQVNGIDIRRYGSQGQQRTAALSLKLAEIELVRQLVKDYPVLLLDDVLSELDSSRQNQLLTGIDHIQSIITCTGLDEFINNRFRIDKVFNVVNGRVINEN